MSLPPKPVALLLLCRYGRHRVRCAMLLRLSTAAVAASGEAAQTLALAREHFGTATPLAPFASPAHSHPPA